MSDLLAASPAPAPAPRTGAARPRRRHLLTWGVIVPGVTALVAITGLQGRRLWAEYAALKAESYQTVHSRVVGYHGVTPDFSYAKAPGAWIRDDGDITMLWAGWDRRAGEHQYFRFPKGQIAPGHLSHPIGRDTLRAVDDARVETKGGVIWDTIPPDHLVVAAEVAGLPIAYPLAMMDKVIAINDTVYKRPLLVIYSPFADEDSSVEMINPLLDGKRLTMGHSGYLFDKKPLLYDRQTSSLWVAQVHGLVAVAGPKKGAVLKRLTRMNSFHWGEWSESHPDARLVVGANRLYSPQRVASR